MSCIESCMKRFMSNKSENYKEQVELNLVLVGKREYDNTKSPRPEITHPVHYGEEFILVEKISLENLQELQAQNIWVMATRKAFPDDRPKRVPLAYLAVKKSLSSYSWFHADIDRVEAVTVLQRGSYPVGKGWPIRNKSLDYWSLLSGTFIIRERTSSNDDHSYVLSVITEASTNDQAAKLRHYKIYEHQKYSSSDSYFTFGENSRRLVVAIKRFLT